MTTLYF